MREKINQLIVVVSSALLNLTTINSMWVPTQDWYLEWARNISNGRTPYVDFFLPFPPLYVEIYRLFGIFPDPLITSRIFNLIVYCVMALYLYKISRLKLSGSFSVILGFGLAFVIGLEPTDTIAGYFEFATMLAAIGVYHYLVNSSFRNKIISGVFLALASLVKQNFVLAVLVFITFETVELIRYARTKQKFKEVSKGFVIGATSVYGIFSIYLLINENFVAFIRAMLMGGGKNLQFSNLVYGLFYEFGQVLPYVMIFFIAIAGAALIGSTKLTQKLYIDRILASGFLALAVSFLAVNAGILSFKYILIVWFLFFVYFALNKLLQKDKYFEQLLSFILIISVPLIVIFTWVISNSNSSLLLKIWQILVEKNNFELLIARQTAQELWIVICFICILIVYVYLTRITTFQKLYVGNIVRKYSNEIVNIPKDYFIVIIGLSSAMIVNSFNGAAALVSNLVIGAVVLSWFFSQPFIKPAFIQVFQLALVSSLIIATPIMTINTYSWFGWNEQKTPNVESKLELFSNFQLTTMEEEFFSKIKLKLDKAIEISGETSPSIAVFPAQPIFNDLAEISPINLSCPISWIDICPDSWLQKDLSKIQEGLPSIVVYYALPSETMAGQDSYYRNGKKSVLSEILNHLQKSNGSYSQFAKVPVKANPGSFVYVFVRK